MSSLPYILPTVRCDGPQSSDGPANVPTAAAGIAGLFADVMAQALSSEPKESVTPPGRQSGEIEGENQQPLKAVPVAEAGKFFSSVIPPKQIVAPNVLSGNSAWPVAGTQKPGTQPNALQSNPNNSSESPGKPNESSKSSKNSQLPVEQTGVCPVQPEVPINQMVAVTVPVADFIPKSLPVSTPVAELAASQRPARNAGPAAAYQVIPAQSKSVSSVPPVPAAPEPSTDNLKNEIVARQPSAVSVAASMTTEAADSAATNAESLSNSAKALLLDAKPNAESGHDSISEPASSSQEAAAQTSPDINGISIAKQDITVNQADKTNNVAGQTGKVLPGNTVLASQGNSPLPSSAHMEQVAATASMGDQGSSNLPSAAVSVQSAAISSASNAGNLERTQEMITVNAVRLSDSGNNAMQVVIKPDAGTQLSLELRQHGAGVQVQAVLQQGDFNHLSQQWPDLQQRLTQRGIHLAPLAGDATAASTTGGESFQQKQQQTAEPASAAELQMTDLPARQVIPTIVQAPLIAREPAQRGWETWA
jgi:hypothetical protein